LAGELARAEERERRRVAQVIHDHLQQLLVVARLNVGIIERQTRNANIRKDLTQIDDVIGEALETARTLTAELSPAVLYRSGLQAALGWLSRWYHDKYAITVELEADQGIAVQSEEVRITLYRSVSELLFNAVKHAHTKVVHVRLSQTTDGRTQIVVSDAGVGFDPREARAREGSGGGFGLFNLRERLESLGGTLEVVSEPGCGTRVTVLGPRLAPPRAETPSREPASRPASGRRKAAGGGRAIRILLVDDHAVVRDGLIRAVGNTRGLEVVGQAANGLEALDEARRLRPHVVLMDVGMPVMDGVEATRALRTELPDVKVIGLSMFDDETHGAEMRSAGAVAFVHKTAPTSAIVQAIREHAGMPRRPARGSRAPRPPRASREPERT
jgi:CheY-like chemotaxis protein